MPIEQDRGAPPSFRRIRTEQTMCANVGKSWSGNPESWRAHQFVKMRVVANSTQAHSLRKCTTDTAFSEMVRNVNSTPTKTARTELNSMITLHHANTRGSKAGRLRIAHLCVLKQLSSTCHVSFLAALDTDHKHKFSHVPHLSFRRSLQHTQDLRYTNPISHTKSERRLRRWCH